MAGPAITVYLSLSPILVMGRWDKLMDQKRYKVIFNGDSVPSYDVERVKNNLAHLFRTNPADLDVLFQDRLVVLKKNLDLTEADRYREAVERIGGYCIIESMQERAQDSVMNLTTKQEKMVCPKCHSVQSKNPVCRSCGILIGDFRKRIAADQAAVMESLQRRQPAPPAEATRETPDIDPHPSASQSETSFNTDELPPRQ